MTHQQSLQQLTEAERILDQRKQTRVQQALQTASLCTAILAQIPEHRDGIDGIVEKSISYLDVLLAQATSALMEPDEFDDDPDEESDDDLLVPALGAMAE